MLGIWTLAIYGGAAPPYARLFFTFAYAVRVVSFVLPVALECTVPTLALFSFPSRIPYPALTSSLVPARELFIISVSLTYSIASIPDIPSLVPPSPIPSCWLSLSNMTWILLCSSPSSITAFGSNYCIVRSELNMATFLSWSMTLAGLTEAVHWLLSMSKASSYWITVFWFVIILFFSFEINF